MWILRMMGWKMACWYVQPGISPTSDSGWCGTHYDHKHLKERTFAYLVELNEGSLKTVGAKLSNRSRPRFFTIDNMNRPPWGTLAVETILYCKVPSILQPYRSDTPRQSAKNISKDYIITRSFAHTLQRQRRRESQRRRMDRRRHIQRRSLVGSSRQCGSIQLQPGLAQGIRDSTRGRWSALPRG